MIQVLEVFGEPISYGGQESFFFNVLQHIDMDNLKIDVFTPYYCDNELSRKTVEDHGGRLTEIGLLFEPGKSRTNIYKPLISHLRKNKYDVVHIHSGSISVLALAALAARRAKTKKIIVHSHATGNGKTLKYRLTKIIMTPLLDFCPTDYCACSKEAGAWKFSHRSVKKLVVLKNGVDLERFRYSPETRQKIRDQYGIKQDNYVIGHVGRFSYEKNQQFIVDLIKEIKTEIPSAKAMLVGAGDTLKKTKEQAQKNGLKEDIFFIGNVNNVQDYLQAMDVFVLPSLFEGLGIVGVEAQAAGLNVIASTNVPQALKLSSLVQFISLKDVQRWKRETIKAVNNGRLNVSKQIRLAGYEIRETAAQLQKIYQGNN